MVGGRLGTSAAPGILSLEIQKLMTSGRSNEIWRLTGEDRQIMESDNRWYE